MNILLDNYFCWYLVLKLVKYCVLEISDSYDGENKGCVSVGVSQTEICDRKGSHYR